MKKRVLTLLLAGIMAVSTTGAVSYTHLDQAAEI